MRIGITVNGVLRETLDKLVSVYNRYNEDSVSVESIDNLDLLSYFKFETQEELINFMYVECPMEIFGNCPAPKDDTFFQLNKFYKEFRDVHEITIFSEEIEKSKSATLFFLAKYGCLVDNIKFFGLNSFYDSVWGEVDLMITSDGDLLEKQPADKKSIKLDDKFNKEINSDFTITQLSEIFDIDIFKYEENEIKE